MACERASPRWRDRNSFLARWPDNDLAPTPVVRFSRQIHPGKRRRKAGRSSRAPRAPGKRRRTRVMSRSLIIPPALLASHHPSVSKYQTRKPQAVYNGRMVSRMEAVCTRISNCRRLPAPAARCRPAPILGEVGTGNPVDRETAGVRSRRFSVGAGASWGAFVVAARADSFHLSWGGEGALIRRPTVPRFRERFRLTRSGHWIRPQDPITMSGHMVRSRDPIT